MQKTTSFIIFNLFCFLLMSLPVNLKADTILQQDDDSSDSIFNSNLSITLNGIPIVHDDWSHSYLGTCPDYCFGANYIAKVFFYTMKQDCVLSLKIDEINVDNASEYKFVNVQGGTKYKLSVYESDSLIATSYLTFTSLPIIEINGADIGENYTKGNIRLLTSSENEDSNYIFDRIKWRGNSSRSCAKKSFAIKLYSDSVIFNDSTSLDKSFLNLRSDNNWILDAMALDSSLARNRVSMDLWIDFSVRPFYFSQESKAINGTRGKYVELVLNGSYNGVYCMSEKIDRKQLKLKKYEEESSVIRGLLYKASDWSTSTLMTDVSGFDNKSSTWNQWEIKYPDLNEGQIITWQPLYNLVRFVAYSNETAFVDSADIYLDLSVFRDYSLFTELISGVDNMGKNTYFYKYNDSKYSQFDIAPWDLDLTWGMTYIDRIEKYDNSKIGMGDLRLVSRLKEYNYGIFSVDSMAYRYAQLRETYFDRDSLYNRFLTYINRLITSGAGKRNQDRWGTNDLDKELQFLSVWIDNRLSFLDDKYGYTGIHKEKNSINEVLVDNASDRVSSVWRDGNQIYIHKPTLGSVNVYSISGRLMKHIEVSGEDVVCLGAFHSGIYVVNGAKIYIP
jgi:hypothetical protein